MKKKRQKSSGVTKLSEKSEEIFRGGVDIHRKHDAAGVISREGGIISHRGPYQVLMDHHGHIAIRTSLPEESEISIVTLTNNSGIHVRTLSTAAFEEAQWAPYHYPLTRVAEKYVDFAADWPISAEAVEHLELILSKKLNRDKIRIAIAVGESSKTTTATTTAKPLENGGVPLKKICLDAGIDPRVARRLLRAKGEKPEGRWEWSPADAEKIVEFLKGAQK